MVADLLGHGVDRRRVALVSPATTALALASHQGYVAVVPELAATDELRAGTVARTLMTLPRASTALDWVHPATPTRPWSSSSGCGSAPNRESPRGRDRPNPGRRRGGSSPPDPPRRGSVRVVAQQTSRDQMNVGEEWAIL